MTLGGEKWFENMSRCGCIHSAAGVADRKHHVLAGHNLGVGMGVRLSEVHIAGFDNELSALRHSIPGIDYEIHDDLLDFSGIGFDAAALGIGNNDEFDLFAERALQHVTEIADEIDEGEDPGREHLLAAKSEQFSGQPGGAL